MKQSNCAPGRYGYSRKVYMTTPELELRDALQELLSWHGAVAHAVQHKTLEQKVQELADREEIRELIAQYAQRVAHRVPFWELFTEGGTFINRQDNIELRGRRNLAAFFERSMASGTPPALPMMHNEIIAISGNMATGLCSNEVRMSLDGRSIARSGYYVDQFRREDGRWKFVMR